MFSVICVWINGWVNNREAGDLRRYGAHYDAIVMEKNCLHFVDDIPKSVYLFENFCIYIQITRIFCVVRLP